MKGRIRSVQPKGVSQSSHLVLGPESAIMRKTNATPNAAMPKPVASRRDRPSCDVSAPTPTNTAAGSTMLAPYNTVSPNPKPTSGFCAASKVISGGPGEEQTDRRTERQLRRARRARRTRAAGEHELPAARVLLAA